MSEPVSNVEIEDVLSSIRRLVSEENRPPLRRKPKDEPRKPTRLVLTPSLLVTDSVADASEDEAVSEPVNDSPENAGEAAQVTGLILDEPETANEVSEENAEEMAPAAVDAEIDGTTQDATTEISAEISQEEAQEHIEDAAQSAEADEPADLSDFEQTESDDPGADPQGDDAPWIDPDTTLFEAAESAETPSDDNMDLSDDNLAETAQETVTEDQEQTDTLSDDAATDEASAQPGWWRAQTPDENAQPLETQDDTGDIAPSEPTGSEEGSAQTDETDPHPTGDDRLNTATLSDKIAALEAKIGQTQDQWEPDGETDDDYAGTPVETIEWQDHDASAKAEVDTDADVTPPDAEIDLQDAEATNATAAPDQSVPNDDDDVLDILSDDDTILDEESLRELVAEIVRQELQGALGERITRNVRKLVRREIHRALTAQELD